MTQQEMRNEIKAKNENILCALKTKREMYNEALKADTEWSLAVERIFGKKAGDARYDARGVSTPELKALYDAKVKADAKLFNRD